MRYSQPFSVRVYVRTGQLFKLEEREDYGSASGTAMLWQRLADAIRIEVVKHATTEHGDRLLASYERATNGIFYNVVNPVEAERKAVVEADPCGVCGGEGRVDDPGPSSGCAEFGPGFRYCLCLAGQNARTEDANELAGIAADQASEVSGWDDADALWCAGLGT